MIKEIILSTSLSICPLGLNAEELRFCHDPYPPYTIGSFGTPEGGMKVALLSEVVERIDGVTATIELMPWKRCQVEVEQGNLDGILPLYESEERRSYLAFSDDTFEQTSVFWYLKSRFPDGVEWGGDVARISDLKLGMLNGSIVNADMERGFESKRGIARATDVPALFLMLEYERVDVVAIDAAVGRYHLASVDMPERFGSVEPPISSRPSRFGLSKVTGADTHLEAFNAAIAALRAEGRIEAILYGRD